MKTDSTTERASALQLLVLGSNEQAAGQLAAAREQLQQQFELLAASACLQSAPIHDDGAPPYLNQAVLIATALPPTELKQRLRAIEASLGRVRPAPHPGLCPIDIDLVAELGPPLTVWDPKSWNSSYGRSVIRDLMEFAKCNNIEGFVQPPIDTV